MTVVLVNGNPETAAVWAPLLRHLRRDDVVTLPPPGFGAATPEGFSGTYDEYAAWLTAELERIGEPVDAVGHDWGANFVIRVVCERPELFRSWSVDTAGVFAPGYRFPDVSRIWQTPGAGEEAMAGWLGMGVAARKKLNESLGMTPEVAGVLAEAFDQEMVDCILAVYRSVTDPVLGYWRGRLPAATARPGLVIVPGQDGHTGGEQRHRWTAERTGARVEILPELGHWWMVQDPARAAEVLDRFWRSLRPSPV